MGEAVLSTVGISKALRAVSRWQGSTVLTVDISALEDELYSSRIGTREVSVAVEIELHKVRKSHKANRDCTGQLVAVQVELLEELKLIDAGGDRACESVVTHIPEHQVNEIAHAFRNIAC